MALVAPSVSTSVRFLTTAFAAASCFAPYDSKADTKAGMPVGIAEIAIAVPSNMTWENGIPRNSATTTITATADQAMVPSTFVSWSSSRCNGERVRLTSVSIDAMRPISVCIPVAVTTTVAVPRVTEVFWKSMFVRSPSATSGPVRTSEPLLTGALSPVSAASCVSRVAERRMRASAGAMSPASICTTSPGTRSVAATIATEPSRTARLCGTCIRDSASTLARAFSSCRVPRTRFRTTSSATVIAVGICPITRLITVTAINMRFIGSRSCAAARRHSDGGGSLRNSFGP